ncbi:hypothetical protein THRCLA_10119 [Thraustotheca clavata]|uniref:Uncharacterized protein n=1 Tax=Thraustotheca clavata TaxID=74557 RepID=A0A1V9YSQ2_9STRA|nr:hypothetical protein THRCLA_10119 [Thraustotheca clavata]
MSSSQPLLNVAPSRSLESNKYILGLTTGNLSILPLRNFAGVLQFDFIATATAFSSNASTNATILVTVEPVVSIPKAILSVPVMRRDVSSTMSIYYNFTDPIGYTELSHSTLVLTGFGISSVKNILNDTITCMSMGSNTTVCPLSDAFKLPTNISLLLEPVPNYAGVLNISLITVYSIMDAPTPCMLTYISLQSAKSCCQNATLQCSASQTNSIVIIQGDASVPTISLSSTLLNSTVGGISSFSVQALDIQDPYKLQGLNASIVCPQNVAENVILYQKQNLTALSKLAISGSDIFALKWLYGKLPIGIEFSWSKSIAASMLNFNCTIVAQSYVLQYPNSTAMSSKTFGVQLSTLVQVLRLPQTYFDVLEGDVIAIPFTLNASTNMSLHQWLKKFYFPMQITP